MTIEIIRRAVRLVAKGVALCALVLFPMVSLALIFWLGVIP